MFTGLLDEHAPVKKRLIKREHVPFMTTELLGAIRRRRRLKQTYYVTKDLADWQKYKEQRNKTSSLRRKLICKYIRSKCVRKAILDFLDCNEAFYSLHKEQW